MKIFFLALSCLIILESKAQSSDNPYHAEETPKEGMTLVRYQDKYGYLNDKRKEVINVQYAFAKSFSKGLAQVSLNKKDYGYIDKQGKVVIPLIYEAFMYGFQDGYSPAKMNGKWGIISDKGKTVVPHRYDQIYYFFDGLAVVGKDKPGSKTLYGYVDEKGNEVIPLKYDHAGSFFDGLAVVQAGNKYGFVNKQGGIVIPFQFDEASGFSEGLAAVKTAGKWGFIDRTNKMVIPQDYQKVYSFKNNEAEVQKNGVGFCIDKTGKRLKDGRWLLLYTKGLKLGDQYWYRNDTIDRMKLYKKYQEGFRFTDYAYNQHQKEIFVIMSNAQTPVQMGINFNQTYESLWKKASDYINTGNSISHIAYERGKWSWNGIESGRGKADVLMSGAGIQTDKIEQYKKQGKFITTLAFGDGRFIVGLRNENYSDQFIKQYEFDKWDDEDVANNLARGYAITHVVKRAATYTVVFTKGTGIKEQLLKWEEEIPTRDIKSYWDDGYKSYKSFYLPRSITISNNGY